MSRQPLAASSKARTVGPRPVLIDDTALFALIVAPDALAAAWARVRDNAGAAGGDGVPVERFERAAAAHLARLAARLRDGSYHPGPVRHVDIPKPAGGLRRLAIPCVVDRIAQTAVAAALTPLLDAEFEDASFGYRAGRSVDQAVNRLQLLRAQGYEHVVDADIEGYFDAVPHDPLLARLAQSLADGPITGLIALWLAAAAPGGRGLAQGSPLSPLLANLYLDRLDEAFASRDARIVRFADDFVILTRRAADADAALTRAAALLAEHGLALNRDKTRVTDFARGFRFLGHLFVRSLVLRATPESADARDAAALLAEVAHRDADAGAALAADDDARAAAEAKGHSPGLRTLYVLEPGRRLHVRNQAFSVEEPLPGRDPLDPAWRELIAVPHQRVDRIDLGPGVALTPAAIDHAAATATPVALLDGHGGTRATLAPALAPRARRHLAQAATVLDPARRLALARILVEGRLRNQRNLLRKLLRDRDPPPAAAVRAIAELGRHIGRGGAGRVAAAASVDVAMGHEGAGAAAYWPAIGALVVPEFAFATRERGPDASPADIALNFLAWLLERDVAGAVAAADLHPGFGALHAVSDRRDAAVFDLMEEFRGHMIEGLLVYVVNRRILRCEMFERAGTGWRMVRGGAAALVRAYEARAAGLIASRAGARRVTFRRRMAEQAHALAAHCEGGPVYTPFESPF